MKLRFTHSLIFPTALFSIALFSTETLAPIQPARAEDVFSWTDASGRKVFGSKPPASANRVAPVKKITLGRYSSDKVLRSLGKSPGASSRKASAGGTNPQPSAGVDERTSFDSVALESGEVQIKRDEQQRVTECVVAIKNSTALDAGDVSVAFEFPEGTLVPAVGPSKVAANSEQLFTLPKELIPLKLKLNGAPPEKAAQPPRVIVHGFASAPGEPKVEAK